MTTRWGTALSLAGVLAAGAVAALVNSQVLDTSTSRPARASSSDPWGPAATDIDESVSSEAPRKKARKAVLLDEARQPGDPYVYAVSSAGTVTLRFERGRLRLVNSTPVEGWRVVSEEKTGRNQIQVVFRSATARAVFTAAVAGDNVVALVSVERTAPTTTVARPSPPPVTVAAPTTTTTSPPPPSTRPPRPTTTPPTTTPPTTAPPATDPPPTTAPPVTDPPPTTAPPVTDPPPPPVTDPPAAAG